MKHNLKITLFLIFLFLASHVIGLFIIKHYLPKEQQLPLNIQKPEFKEETSYIPIIITIIIATVVALLLLKFKAFKLWKIWFFFAVFITLTISFSAFVIEKIAVFIALILTIFRVFKPNIIIHNASEIFIYGGLAAIFIPVLSLRSIIILLIVISIYDVIAVWKTKHMISLAKFQAESNVFAGLSIPYGKRVETKKRPISAQIETNHAILGGGDIGFPLLFSGVVFKMSGFIPGFIVSLTAALALFILLIIAEKKKFYPAMPFLTIGCIVGYFLVKIFL